MPCCWVPYRHGQQDRQTPPRSRLWWCVLTSRWLPFSYPSKVGAEASLRGHRSHLPHPPLLEVVSPGLKDDFRLVWDVPVPFPQPFSAVVTLRGALSALRTWPCQVEYLAWSLGKLGFLCLWGQQPQKGASNTGANGHTAQSILATQVAHCWDQKGRARQKYWWPVPFCV